MSNVRRKVLRILIASVSSLALASFLCLDGVDYRPYLQEAYYSQSEARLAAERATNTVVRGELEAGFGRALLTPNINAPQDDPAKGQFRSLPLAGYGSRHGKPAQGVHDDLYVLRVHVIEYKLRIAVEYVWIELI